MADATSVRQRSAWVGSGGGGRESDGAGVASPASLVGTWCIIGRSAMAPRYAAVGTIRAAHEVFMPDNRQILIASLPTGALAESDYELRTSAVPEPGDGEVLCRTLAITIGAGQRAGLQGSASYAGAPKTGVVMSGTGVARVEASNDPALGTGRPRDRPDRLAGLLRAPRRRPHPRRARRRPGAAPRRAGDERHHRLLRHPRRRACRSPARPSWCRRRPARSATSSARSPASRAVARSASPAPTTSAPCSPSELGFDAAVNYKAADFRDAFKAACGGGIDIYFDNTGGDILGAALRRMNLRGRIVCCGVVSQYDTSNPEPGPRGIPGLLINSRIRMEGFLVFDYADRYDEARRTMKQWIDDGELIARQDEFTGLESAPRAFVDLLAGGNVGTRIVRVAE